MKYKKHFILLLNVFTFSISLNNLKTKANYQINQFSIDLKSLVRSNIYYLDIDKDIYVNLSEVESKVKELINNYKNIYYLDVTYENKSSYFYPTYIQSGTFTFKYEQGFYIKNFAINFKIERKNND